MRYQFPAEELQNLEQLPVSLAVYQFVDGHIHLLALSDGYLEMFELSDRETAYRLLNEDVLLNTHADDIPRIREAVRRFTAESGRYEAIFRARTFREHDCHIIHAVGKHLRTADGVRLAYVWFTDEGAYTEDDDTEATALNRAFNSALHEESILRAGYYDRLTGLPNMAHFFTLAKAGKQAVAECGGEIVLMYMDLIGMKNYNDNYGFAEGDKLLTAFAQVLGRTFGNENCCHISGDRFAAFTEKTCVEEKLERVFRETEALNEGNTLFIRAGVYSDDSEALPVSSACDRAKMACDAIQKRDYSCFRYYSDDMRDKAQRRQYILSHIDKAISEKWIQVYYQPIVRAVNGKISDEEALSRWIDPVEGFLSPADFIPILEEAGAIYKLDLYVLEQVLEKMAEQMRMGFHGVPHSINLSRSDFDACDIVEEVRKRVDASGVGRDRVTIEITESIIGSNIDFIKTQIERFQNLGFAVWMDDFGSGYSSLDVLQSIKFNLLKFDMSFMRKLDEGDNGKILLTELMRMATALGVDTVCEGVETEEQVAFLQEIGCSKLQGYYFSRPIPFEQILERGREGARIGYEDPQESAYYEAIGRINLYDLAVIANEEVNAFQNSFNTIPMGIIEVKDDASRFVRSNLSYRNFMKGFFGIDLSRDGKGFHRNSSTFMQNAVKNCCEKGARFVFDEKLPDGSIVHSFARRIADNPATGNIAVAVAVLSVTEPNDAQTYEEIARALAADYYSIYVVDLDTEQYLEYASPAGKAQPAVERRGGDFFNTAKRDAMTRIYEDDREPFLEYFTKEKIVGIIDEEGAFTATYRLIDAGVPQYARLKITRMPSNDNRIIMGVSIIESEIRRKEANERERRRHAFFRRIAALSGKYYALYVIDPQTGFYYEYNVTSDYRVLGYDKSGDDFFVKGRLDGMTYVYPEDLPFFLEQFTRENVMRAIGERGLYRIQYRIMVNGAPKPITLRIARDGENDGDKLVAGVGILDEE